MPNDIAAFLQEHSDIDAIFFNGATAEKLFCTLIASTLPSSRVLSLTRLPSTSPAHASLSFEQKLAAWEVVAIAARRGEM